MAGYIKLYRKITHSPIYQQPPLYLRVFERLIIEANHSCQRIPYDNGTKLIKRGERLTSIRQIAEWVGWYERGILKTPNPKTIKKIIDWLENEKMIEILGGGIKGNRKETHYKVHGYCIYQAKEDSGSNGKETVGKQSVDINNNVNNDINEKKQSETSQEIENFRLRYSEPQLKIINQYLDILRWTRTNGKIADSVILKIYKEWDKHKTEKVIYGLNVYINNPSYHDKKENYVMAIIRNATADQIAGVGKPKGRVADF